MKLEVGSWKLEIGNCRDAVETQLAADYSVSTMPRIPSRKHEVGSWKLEIVETP
jgi:hypothetical protein